MSTSPKSPNEQTGRSRTVWIIAPVVILVVAGSALGLYMVSRSGGDSIEAATFAVRRGPLTIKVSGTGTTSPLDQVVIKCQVEGRNTILDLIDQGTEVQAGDLLVRLDSSQLEDSIVNQEITVRNSDASQTRAVENLKVTLSQNTSDKAKAQLDVQFAEQNYRKYIEGEYPQQLQQAEADITLAKVELSRANDKLFYSKQLYEKGFITRTELQADELSVTRNELDLTLAEGKLQLLKQYTYTQQVDQLKSDIDQAKMALDRVLAKANADEVQARADLAARQAEHQRQSERLVKLTSQLEHCIIKAPEAGKVVYATTSQRNRWRPAEPLEEGSEVREGQELIHLPRPGGMKATIKIHESSLGKLKEAQVATDKALPVRLTVDSIDGKVWWGWVHSIAPLPDQSNWMRPDVKVYDVEVHLTGDTSKLITGNTCRADIIIKQFDQAIYVPVQSVVREKGKSVVYTVERGSLEPNFVQTGLSDNEYVVITDGLQAGQQVSLSPPLDKAGQTDQQESPDQQVPETPDKKETRPAEQPAQAAEMTFEKFKAMSAEQRREWMQSAGRDGVRSFFGSLSQAQRNELRQMMDRPGGREGGRESESGRPGGRDASQPAARSARQGQARP